MTEIPKVQISNQEIGNLLSAEGNGEPKALLVCAMKPGFIYSSPELHKLLIEAQGVYAREGWRIAHGVPFQYCRDSLAPIGLVTKEVLDPDLSVWGYIKTDYGERVGVSLAGHLLSTSEKYPNVSLFEVFGGTSSVSHFLERVELEDGVDEFKKRSPMVRFKMLWEMLTCPLPIRLVDLVNAVGEGQEILSDHVRKLSAFGLIEYDAVKSHEPYSYYTLINGEKDPNIKYIKHHGKVTIKQQLYSIILSHPGENLTYEDLWSHFFQANPDRQVSKRHFYRKAACYFAEWAEAGIIAEGRFSYDMQSLLNLTSNQRLLLGDYVSVIDRFQTGDPLFLQEGLLKACEIINDPKIVAVLMRKARNKSPHARRFYKDNDLS